MPENRIIIENLKGIRKLDFELPRQGVHVITAGNGCGKTSLLVCIERIKNTAAFRENFKQQKFWNVDSYDKTQISYVSNRNNSVTYTYRRKSDSWRPLSRGIDAINDFGYSEIKAIPTLGKRVYTQTKKLQRGAIRAASSELRSSMARVLENSKFERLLKVSLGETRGRGGASRRNNTAFLLHSEVVRKQNKSTNYYFTEMSFSLGEIFALNLLFELEVISDGALLVIDELEVALHPRVQINLLRYIEEKAVQKNLTVIISTHSSSLIKCASNLIFLEKHTDNTVQVHYHCYPAIALREVSVNEDMQPDYVFFVEDYSAEFLLKEKIKHYFKLTNNRQPIWKILPIGGYPEVLRFTKKVNAYLIHNRIGQYAFLDEDVLTVKNELRRKGNNRSSKENELWELFQNQDQRIKYFSITPELGLIEWIFNNVSSFDSKLNDFYPDSSINTRDLIQNCRRAFPNNAVNPREDAKNKLAWLINQLLDILNEDSKKRIQKSLFELYSEEYYSDQEHQNTLRRTFGPIFNTRGN